MSVSEESWYGGSEELALTGTTRADPAVRCHIILSSTAPTIFKLPRASMQANEGGGNHWVFNFGTNAISLRDYSNGLILALAQDEGAICSLVDNGSDAGEWRAILYTIDAGPAPSPPVFGYFIGGEGNPSVGDDSREWNPGGHVWTVYADTLPGYGYAYGATSFVVGDNLYITRNWATVPGLLELTTPNTWTARTTPPMLEYNGSGCGLNDGVAEYGYTFGGYGPSAPKDEVEIYDAPPADSWSYGTVQTEGHYYAGATAIANKAYITGGRNDGGGNMGDTHEEYDPGPAPDTWTTKTSLPIEGRGRFGSAEADGFAFVMCGTTSTAHGSGINVRDTNERYNPTSDEWAQRQIHPIGRRSAPAAVSIGDNIYLAGGLAYDGPEYPDYDEYMTPETHLYDDSTQTWTEETDMNQGVQRWENHCQAVQT